MILATFLSIQLIGIVGLAVVNCLIFGSFSGNTELNMLNVVKASVA